MKIWPRLEDGIEQLKVNSNVTDLQGTEFNMFVMKVGTLVQLWKPCYTAHVAARTDWCTEIVRSITS